MPASLPIRTDENTPNYFHARCSKTPVFAAYIYEGARFLAKNRKPISLMRQTAPRRLLAYNHSPKRLRPGVQEQSGCRGE